MTPVFGGLEVRCWDPSRSVTREAAELRPKRPNATAGVLTGYGKSFNKFWAAEVRTARTHVLVLVALRNVFVLFLTSQPRHPETRQRSASIRVSIDAGRSGAKSSQPSSVLEVAGRS